MVATPPETHRRSRLAWLAALALASTFAGCGGTTPPPGPGGAGSPPAVAEEGTVDIDGSSTVYPISTAAQEGFNKDHPNIQVIVGNSGTGGGFTKYNRGDIDIVDASRPATAKEEAKAKQQGIDWHRFLVGYDGITVVVHPQNSFVKELTFAQLKRLFEPGSTVKTWKDLDPSWPDRPINVYSPDDKSGTFDFFGEKVVGGKTQRDGVQHSADDNSLVTGVIGDPDAIAYFGYAYYKENADKLVAVPIKEKPEGAAVTPGPESIISKAYPLSRPLFIYVKKSSYRRPAVKAFVDYYLGNVADLAGRAKYVAPTPDDLQANAAEVKSTEAKPAEAKPTP